MALKTTITKMKKFSFKTLIDLALSYFKIGLFTFGGGLAMISLLEHEYVENRKWIEQDEFEDVVTLAILYIVEQ